MSGEKGYIYIRKQESYELHKACKLGKTINIPERDSNYVTGEIQRGYFEDVYEISIEIMGTLEKLLQDNFVNMNTI